MLKPIVFSIAKTQVFKMDGVQYLPKSKQPHKLQTVND
jgi:hypothetical protein